MEDSDDEFPVERRAKRRKLLDTRPGSEHLEGYMTDTSDQSVSVHSEDIWKGSGDEASAQQKPKSKYRIHIPRNGDLPKDAFFTQPPERSSSPYRIEPFYWQKPKKTVSDQTALGEVSDEHTKCHRTLTNHHRLETNYVEPWNLNGVSLGAKTQQPLALELSPKAIYEDVLADLPSDAFSSPESGPKKACDEPIAISSQLPDLEHNETSSQTWQALKAPPANLRQTTLFGKKVHVDSSSSQSTKRHNWPLASREEPPTHHLLNANALQTWVYPTNLGGIREYQYGIVAKGLYHNLLVALPTGLGKTFIAATIMLNWFRWTQDAQIVFVAPTRPLVSQQVKACFEVAGIPRADTVMLTGNTAPGVRAEEWHNKRVFFMTPQTLVNDLKSGIADPKRIVLIVVDEAHRATGSYAYVEVVKFLSRFNSSFRVLALTATPGASVESVQEVIDGLGISRVEIRTEESLDIRQYVHARKIETVLFDYSDEITMLMELFSKALQPLLNKLNGMNAYWAKDPLTLTPYSCSQASRTWMASDAGRKAQWGTKTMVLTTFSLLASFSHGTELLKFHGIGPFFRKMVSFRDTGKDAKKAQQVTESEHFQRMMTILRSWTSKSDFVGHPKLEYVQSVAMNHFLDAGDGRGTTDPSRTRIMVFAHYRDSAEEIARVLKRNEPMIRPHVFVGQANSKESEGMDQKTQLSVINKFKDGTYNTLVATSIGEEGLDIGEIDLIICYDASASPIRMLQRMGRTGRKRAGNIVVTLMKGKEENNFIKAKDNYEKMQHEIAAGSRFSFHDESNRRIIPKNVQPVVDKRIVDIPPENTQPDLPEPLKRAKAPKRPPKKFHMPGNVRTGFVKASRFDEVAGEEDEELMNTLPPRTPESPPISIPSLGDVLLTEAEEKELERTYLDVKGDAPQLVQVPSVNAFPNLQRDLRPISHIEHGGRTIRTVSMLGRMYEYHPAMDDEYERALQPGDRKAGIAQVEKRAAFLDRSQGRHQSTYVERPIGLVSGEDTAATTLGTPELDAAPRSLRVTSSAFSPPSIANLNKPYYLPASRMHAEDFDSGDDLPDFGPLMGKSGTALENSKPRTDKEESVSMFIKRKARRRIIEDDSDDG